MLGTARARTAHAVHRMLGGRYLRQPFGVGRGLVLPADGGFRAAMGLYEMEIARFVSQLVEPHFTCYDVGAARGLYTLALARRATAGHVVAFEPDETLLAQLPSTLARNAALAARVTVVPLAVGAEVGPTVTSVDAFVTERGPGLRPHFLKVDVEGAEHDVLRGALDAIRTGRPRFIIESHGFEVEAACLQLLASEGYGYLIVNAQRLWPEHRPIEVNRWVVAVHRSDPKATILT